jgi:tetratricopeptide (TPR) repeat protein
MRKSTVAIVIALIGTTGTVLSLIYALHTASVAKTREAHAVVTRAFASVSRGFPSLPETRWLPVGREKEQLEEALTETARARDNVLGILLQRDGQYDHAMKEYQTALRLVERDAPWRALILDNIGALQSEQCQYVAAERSFRASLEAKDHALAHANLADCLLRQNRVPDARAHIRLALKKDPHSVGPHLVYGKILWKLNARDEAIAELKTARDIDPMYQPDAHLELSKSLAAMGDPEGALDEASAAIDVAPNFAEAHEWYAGLLEKSGDVASAKVERRRVQELKRFRKPNTFC